MKKRRKSFLALFLAMVMVMGAIPSISAYAEDNQTGQKDTAVSEENINDSDNKDVSDEKTDQKDGVSKDQTQDKTSSAAENSTPEDKKTEPVSIDEIKVKISASGAGSLTAIKSGAAEENRVEVLAGSSRNISVKKGDRVEIVTYADTNARFKTKLSGVKEISREKKAENNYLIVYEVEAEDASIDVSFTGGLVSRQINLGRTQLRAFRAPMRAASAVSTTITQEKVQYGYNTSGSSYFPNKYGKFNSSAGYGGAAYCGEHDRTPTTGSFTGTVYTDSTMRKIVYYGYRGPAQWSGFSNGAFLSKYQLWGPNTSRTEVAGIVVTAQALSNRYNALGGQGTSTNPAGLSEFMAYVNSQPDPGSSWTLYRIVAGGQDMFFGQYVPKGKVQILKEVASNKALTEECKNMYSLAGAEYTVYSNGNPVGKLVTDANGATGTLELTPGTYTVKETKAPKGFALDQQTYTVSIASGQTATVNSKDEPQFDPVSVVLKKIATDGSYLNDGDMSDAEFTIRYYDSMSDDVSNLTPIRTWKLKTLKDKAGTYGAQLRSKYVVDGSDEFYKNEQGNIVIPRGTITIQETKAPKGYKVDPKVYTYKVDQDSEDQSIHLNFGNTPEQPNKPLVPQIGTTASDVSTKDNVGSYGKTVTIKDKVQYKELSEGETYTVKGTLMDTETGLPLMVNGKAVSAEKTFTVTKDNSTITGDGASGSVELEYTLDSTVLAGKTTTVFEYLYYDGKQIATHADISDEGQTVHFPEIKTTAKSKDTDAHQGMPGKTETIVDTIHYTNLVPGKSYTVKGKLMDKGSGKAILDGGGKEITAEKTFTPDQAEGDVELEFTYDSSLRQGKSTVVFEDLYHEDVEVATHSDISDRNQTIDYPDIHTSADLKQTGRMTGGTTTIIDRVTYTNLAKGKTYTVKGKLMDRKTGLPLISDGKEITAKKTFTATDINGTVVMEFTVPVKLIAGKSTVVFEDMYHEDVKIATHSDLTDKNQTVSIGELTVSGNGEGGFPITGDSSKILYAIAALAFAVVALGGIVHMHNLNKRRK